jgi:hypothetical protein
MTERHAAHCSKLHMCGPARLAEDQVKKNSFAAAGVQHSEFSMP